MVEGDAEEADYEEERSPMVEVALAKTQKASTSEEIAPAAAGRG